jgi:hypothetical protein
MVVDDGTVDCAVRGCTNPTATNYNPAANVDDGSCVGGYCNEVRCGHADRCDEDEYCASPAELHEVSCCSDTDLGGWSSCTVGGAVIFAEREAGDLECTSDATLASAEAVCAAVGARLCTLAELEANCGHGTGCGHDGTLAFFSVLFSVHALQ